RTYGDYIHHGSPVATQLSYLLSIHIEQKGDFVCVLRRLSLYVGHIDSSPRCSGQDSHQGPFRVAVADVKDFHFPSPVFIRPRTTSLKPIPPKAPSDKH